MTQFVVCDTISCAYLLHVDGRHVVIISDLVCCDTERRLENNDNTLQDYQATFVVLLFYLRQLYAKILFLFYLFYFVNQ